MAESATTDTAPDVGAGTQGAAPAATGGTTGQPDPADYEARLRSSHEFAAKMAKEAQARATRIEQENQQLRSFQEMVGDDLAQIIKTASGPEVAKAVREYIMLANQPEVASGLVRYRETGQFQLQPRQGNGSAPATPEDEYLTPEERKIQGLERMVTELSARVASQERGTGQSALEGHFEKVSRELPFSEAELGKMRRRLTDMSSRLDAQGMRNLAAPQSFETVRGVLLSALTPDELGTVFDRKKQQQQNSLRGLATDRPFETSSQGEPAPSFANGAAAWEWAGMNPDKHNSW